MPFGFDCFKWGFFFSLSICLFIIKPMRHTHIVGRRRRRGVSKQGTMQAVVMNTMCVYE